MFRRKIWLFSAILVLFLAIPAGAENFSGKVVGVLDGDTLEVMRQGQAERVRLQGVDCPEKGQAFGKKARQFTADLAMGKEVTVVTEKTDRYGRTLGYVILPDGRNLNRELVKAGYAWWYRQFSSDSTLGELEAEARTAPRGLWRDSHPIPPWEFRKHGKEKRYGRRLER